MSGVDGGGLSAEEREAHGRRADSFPAMQLVYSLTDVEILLRRRVAAAEQARDLERFKYEHEHKAAVIYADRAKAAEQRAEQIAERAKSCPRHPHWSGMVWDCVFCDREALADPAPREYDDGGPRAGCRGGGERDRMDYRWPSRRGGQRADSRAGVHRLRAPRRPDARPLVRRLRCRPRRR